MTLLLDTHALIWFLDDDIRLPINIRNHIEFIAGCLGIWAKR
jgi:PIN domain nuclease of toxin-antitoxin system